MPSGVKDLQLLELRDTISQLNHTIRSQNEMICSLQKMLEDQGAQKDQLIADLQAQLDYLKQKLFGSSSEHRNDQIAGQMSLFDMDSEDGEKIPEIIEPEIIEVKAYKKKRKPKASYDEMFAALPVRQVIVDTLTEEQKICSLCGSQMVPIGQEVIRTEIRYTEPKLERIEYIATTYGCPSCKNTEEPQFIKDEGEPALIPGSYASVGLVVHVMFAKYVMCQPLYRQEKDFERLGAKIGRTTMAHWIIYCAQHYYQPMFGYFHLQLLTRRHLMADELCEALHNSS